jgi:hypothetical protein
MQPIHECNGECVCTRTGIGWTQNTHATRHMCNWPLSWSSDNKEAYFTCMAGFAWRTASVKFKYQRPEASWCEASFLSLALHGVSRFLKPTKYVIDQRRDPVGDDAKRDTFICKAADINKWSAEDHLECIRCPVCSISDEMMAAIKH